MKVLLTATVQSHICQFHRPLVEVLHEMGCEVHVAAKNNLAEKNGLQLDFADKVFDVPFSRSPKSADNLKAYKQLKQILDEGGYDIIHCNTPMGGIVTRLAARKARKNGAKVFYTAHGFHFYKGASKKNWLVFYPIEKYFADHLTDKLITITDEDYALATRKFRCETVRMHGVGVDENRYYPVDTTAKAALREKMGYSETQKLLLCVGELLPNKNQQMAIRMMQDVVLVYPDAKLLLAGNGPERDNLERLVQTLGLQQNVELLGYVTNLQEYQRIVDISVSCSKREGLPLNIVEAMLSGTPVVATYNRGHRELVKEQSEGTLVPVNDTETMAKQVIELLQDDAQYEQTITAARTRGKLYSASAVKTELTEIYR